MTISANYPTIRPTLLLDFANTKQLDPRITFTRSTTGTYYDGKTTAKAEENLLQQSQTFDNGYWTKSNVTITANTTTAPDGTTTAELIIPSATSSTKVLYPTLTSIAGVYTLSIYAKANGYNFITLGLHNGATSAGNETLQVFNLSTGAVATSYNTAPTSATITSVGNSWYRCVITWTITTINVSPTIWVNETDVNPRTTNWTANGTDGIYIWGAQLEQRSSVTAYTPTTTAPITNYIPVLLTAPANTARFEHNPVTGESLGLEIEEQRTNLLTYSEQFNNAAWNKTGATIAANSVVAPNGTLTGDKLVEDTTTGNHRVFAYTNASQNGVAQTFSAYVKSAGRTWALLNFSDTVDRRTFFDLTNGTIGNIGSGCTASIVNVGNGWYRISVSYTQISVSNIDIGASTGNGTSSYAGDGWSGIYIWGAQLEAGAFATSYIPTVASQVTRSADSASMTGTNFSSWYRQDEGTMYAEAVTAHTTGAGFYTIMSAADAGNNENNLIAIGQQGPANARGIIVTNGSAQASLVAGTLSAGSAFKVSLGYKVNDIAFSPNGAAASTDTSATLPTPIQLFFGVSSAQNVSRYNGTIKKFAYYPLRLTNTNLQALTL